jgi:hypothetical protein
VSLKSVFGLDGFDLSIHGAVTGIVLFWIGAVNRTEDAIIGCSIAACSSLVLLAIRRRLALRRRGVAGLTTGEFVGERLLELEGRLADLEAAQARVVELEERLDFAERLLAQGPPERQAIEGGGRP